MSDRAQFLSGRREPGANVDRVDIAAGVREATLIGYGDGTFPMVVTYGLQRWARGEEDAARKMMLDYGVDLTSIYRIVAAARAAALDA